MSMPQLIAEEAIALAYYLDRDPALPLSLVSLARKLKTSLIASLDNFNLNMVCYSKSFHHHYIS